MTTGTGATRRRIASTRAPITRELRFRRNQSGSGVQKSGIDSAASSRKRMRHPSASQQVRSSLAENGPESGPIRSATPTGREVSEGQSRCDGSARARRFSVLAAPRRAAARRPDRRGALDRPSTTRARVRGNVEMHRSSRTSRRADRIAPAPLVELQAGTIGEEVEAQISKPCSSHWRGQPRDSGPRARTTGGEGNPDEDGKRPDVIVESRLPGELETPLELLAAAGPPCQKLHRAERQGVDKDSVSSRCCASSIARVPQTCGSFGVLCESAKPQRGAVRHGELAAGRSCSSRATASWPVLRLATRPGHQRVAESAKRVAFATPVAELPVALEAACSASSASSAWSVR